MAVSIGSITSANATFMLSVQGLYSSSQQIQQFAADEAFGSESVENGEIVKGVDNFIAAGWIPTLKKLNVTLQANSPSIAIFDNWFLSEEQAQEKIPGSGTITLPGPGKTFSLASVFLFGYQPMPEAKKILQPQKFILVCDAIAATAIATAIGSAF